MVTPKGSMSTEGEILQFSVLPYRCSICPPLVTRQMSNLAVLADSKRQNASLVPVHAMFRNDCPLTVKLAIMQWNLANKKKNLERFCTYWYIPFCCVCLGCCAAEFGSSGGTYELPCIYIKCSQISCNILLFPSVVMFFHQLQGKCQGKTRKNGARPALFLIFVFFYIFFVLFYVFSCCSMYCLFCVVLCIVCVYMCTELLPPDGYPIAGKYIISYFSPWHFIGHSVRLHES